MEKVVFIAGSQFFIVAIQSLALIRVAGEWKYFNRKKKIFINEGCIAVMISRYVDAEKFMQGVVDHTQTTEGLQFLSFLKEISKQLRTTDVHVACMSEISFYQHQRSFYNMPRIDFLFMGYCKAKKLVEVGHFTGFYDVSSYSYLRDITNDEISVGLLTNERETESRLDFDSELAKYFQTRNSDVSEKETMQCYLDFLSSQLPQDNVSTEVYRLSEDTSFNILPRREKNEIPTLIP